MIIRTKILERSNQQQGIKKKKKGRVKETINNVVGAYEELIEHEAPCPLMAYDNNKLPYAKEDIKRCLKIAIAETAEEPLKRNFIEGYYLLAHYHEGVGPEPKGIDVSSIDLDDKNPAKGEVKSTEAQKWTTLIQKEMVQLKKELEDFADEHLTTA